MTVTVTSRKLAFFKRINCNNSLPDRYFARGNSLTSDGSTTHESFWGEKEYLKVSHPIYGEGYVLKEGVEIDDASNN